MHAHDAARRDSARSSAAEGRLEIPCSPSKLGAVLLCFLCCFLSLLCCVFCSRYFNTIAIRNHIRLRGQGNRKPSHRGSASSPRTSSWETLIWNTPRSSLKHKPNPDPVLSQQRWSRRVAVDTCYSFLSCLTISKNLCSHIASAFCTLVLYHEPCYSGLPVLLPWTFSAMMPRRFWLSLSDHQSCSFSHAALFIKVET